MIPVSLEHAEEEIMGIAGADEPEAFEKPAEHGKQGINDRYP
jgi:hypothetical protein